MSETYPKTADKIAVQVTTTVNEASRWSTGTTELQSTLAEVLDGFGLRVGFSSAYVKGVAVQLMTSGKVRLDFRNHRERLELLDYEDILTPPQAIKLLDDHLALHGNKSAAPPMRSDMTQRIMIQPPDPDQNNR